MRVQVGGTHISRWWLLLNSDPEPAEMVSIGSKVAVGVSILIRSATPPAQQVVAALPGSLIAVLGQHAALIGAALIVLAVIHVTAVIHNSLLTRRICALISSGWWFFSVYLVVTLLDWTDARAGTYLMLWAISTWTSWRLWRPGVRGATDGTTDGGASGPTDG
jgi:hypothetical protein